MSSASEVLSKGGQEDGGGIIKNTKNTKKAGAGLGARGWSGKGAQGSGSGSKDKHGVLLLYSPLGCPWLPGQQKQ